MRCFVHFDLPMRFAPQRCTIFPHVSFKKWSEHVVFCAFSLTNVLRGPFFKIGSSKSGPYPSIFSHFDLETGFAPQLLSFFDIVSGKIGPALRCFVHFDLKMRFAPQRRAIFRHLSFKNFSEPAVFCTFWLENALRATAACHFSTSALQKLVRECGVLCVLTCKRASRHSGVPFFISLLNSYLRTRRFTESNIRNHESLKKHSESRLS